jgi:hypothetical protein
MKLVEPVAAVRDHHRRISAIHQRIAGGGERRGRRRGGEPRDGKS